MLFLENGRVDIQSLTPALFKGDGFLAHKSGRTSLFVIRMFVIQFLLDENSKFRNSIAQRIAYRNFKQGFKYLSNTFQIGCG
jgi:hypothetical protein